MKTKSLFTLAVCAILCSFLLAGCAGGPVTAAPTGLTDVDFANAGFSTLANGESVAEVYIDWAVFQAAGQDVGKQYNALPGDLAKSAFRSSFISSFSRSFKAKGATPAMLTNWRIYSQNAGGTLIQADSPSRAILYVTVVTTNGAQKITSIQIR